MRRGLFEATFVDGFPDIHFGSEEVGLTIDNEAQYETEADGKTVKKDEQGNAIVKRNNIVVKAWVPAVTPESQGIQIGG